MFPALSLFAFALLFLVAPAQNIGGNLTVAFFDASQEEACEANDTSRGLVLTTDSVPTSFTCFNVSDIFSQSNNVGFRNGSMAITVDGEILEPNGVHWLLQNGGDFSSESNYSRVWYEQASLGSLNQAGEDAPWVFYIYAFDDCDQIGDDINVDSDQYPWYETSCLTQQGGQCQTLPYSIKSFGINKAENYNRNHDGCAAWAFMGAVIPAPKATLEVREIETPQPGPQELLVKNEVIALQPVDAKIAKLANLPMDYPAIIGYSYAGTVVKVGDQVTGFDVGDRVVSAKTAGATENKYSAFQRYAVASARTTTKLPSNIALDTAASLVGNLATLPALFNATLKLATPDLENLAQPNGKKILIYGGTSSVGSLSVQYLTQAGYDVVTTTSPQHEAFVARLGASKVIDHRQSFDTVVKELVAAGTYDIVVDTISSMETVRLNGEVLAAQGGGQIYTLQPPFGPETLPSGVTRAFESWSLLLGKEENAQLLEWTFSTYFRQALAQDILIPVSLRKIPGGLAGLDGALSLLMKGVSNEKLVLDPWE
ncbi:hypothetical protein FZEAL_5413 [Fusarium zealandicum]|uniref:Enoyl reductase (ER) domain-containing protein n=1 Tax=Fusarium zealandicum TaxID=1053134 RepID=A0A8H4XKI1_9HYPO|nr:hypothetical protein FZEAL_5413 [Fusarium zealandicum]